MASQVRKLVPSDPEKVMVIRKITPDILTCSTPFSRFGRIKIGGRGTIVRLQTGALAVFSPVALTDTVRKESESLGSVKYLVALDQEHHIFLESWHKAYPDARIIGPDTLPEYRDKQKYFKLPAQQWIIFKPGSTPTVSEEFDKEFDMEYVHAHQNKEIVFNHKPSGTVIEADLIFNLPATEQFSKSGENPTSGLGTRIFAAMQNLGSGMVWQKRMLWYLLSSSDRPAFNNSVSRIASWKFDRIIPCHGDVIESGGKGIFEKVMEWHLTAAKKSS